MHPQPSAREEADEIRKELEAKLPPDNVIDNDTIRRYVQIKKEAPWLTNYIGDPKNGKIGIRTAYDIYLALKRKNLLDLDRRIPKSELKLLLTTREGRKIISERDDLLQLILDHKMAVSQAINKLKTEEKLAKSKKSRAKEEEDLDETEEEEGEEDESKGRQRELDENDNEEYDFVGEWQKAKEEEEKQEAKQQLTPQLNGQLLVKQEVTESKTQNDFLNDLKTKGFAELPFEIALIKIEGKCYAINVGALRDLEQGLPEKWKGLEAFLNKYSIIIPDEVEGLYVIPWKLLGRCNEWK